MDFVINFFLNGHKVLDVINNCCCCLILLFILTRFLNNGRYHQPNAAFLLLWVTCVGGGLFFIHHFLGVFLSVPHMIDNYAKNMVERVRNLMCERTLSSLLVFLPYKAYKAFSFGCYMCANV